MMILKKIVLTSVVLAAGGCATKSDDRRDPNVEIKKLEDGLAAADQKQSNVLSPRSYDRSKEALKDAVEARDKGKDSARVLGYVDKGQKELVTVQSVVQKSGAEFRDIVDLRAYAMKVRSEEHAKKEMTKADRALEDYTRLFEVGSESVTIDDHKKLQSLYEEAIVASMTAQYLNPGKDRYTQAVNEGSARLLKDTTTRTEEKIRDTEAFILSNYGNEEAVKVRSGEAVAQSTKLLELTRQARINSGESIEAITLQADQKNAALAALEQQKAREVAGLQSQVEQQNAVIAEKNTNIERRAERERQFLSARSKFTAQEADVEQDGDELMIRLKGLQFARGRSELPKANIDMIGRVAQVVKEMRPARIIVEGFTDLTGTVAKNKEIALSRANVVKSQLEAALAPDSLVPIQALGIGSDRPIASNANPAGRAQNRRVEVRIIKSGSMSAQVNQ